MLTEMWEANPALAMRAIGRTLRVAYQDLNCHHCDLGSRGESELLQMETGQLPGEWGEDYSVWFNTHWCLPETPGSKAGAAYHHWLRAIEFVAQGRYLPGSNFLGDAYSQAIHAMVVSHDDENPAISEKVAEALQRRILHKAYEKSLPPKAAPDGARLRPSLLAS